jgi:hypothetical protein
VTARYRVNDGYSLGRVEPIHRLDLAYELGLVAAWAALYRIGETAPAARR